MVLFRSYHLMSNYRSLKSNKKAGPSRWELEMNELFLLRSIRHLKATHPEDKIYSMHSIFTLLGVSPSKPDYKSPVQKVVEDFVVGYIQSRKNLAMFAITLPTEENTGVPS